MAIVKVGCPAGCCRRFVILLAIPSHSSRQLLCPSASFIQSLLIRSIAPCSLLYYCFSAWHPAAKHIPKRAGCTVPSTSCRTAHLASFHCFLAISFQQASVHPLPVFIFARRQPHLGCIHLAAAIAHSYLISQSIAKVHLHSSATFVSAGRRKFTSVASYVAGIGLHNLPCGSTNVSAFPASTLMGARRPPPFSRSSFSPAAATRLTAHNLGFFWPQALLPACLKTKMNLCSLTKPQSISVWIIYIKLPCSPCLIQWTLMYRRI